MTDIYNNDQQFREYIDAQIDATQEPEQDEETPPAPRKKIYLAGPDVFYPDAVERAAKARELVESMGYEALIPLDGEVKTDNPEYIPRLIYQKNILMIMAADAVVANLGAFRGVEPDSGTVFEIGYAVGLGLPVITYDTMDTTVMDRTVEYFRMRAGPGMFDANATGDTVFPDGMKAESFNMTHNLMLMYSTHPVHGTLKDALSRLELTFAAQA